MYEEESGAQDEGFGMKFMPSLVGKLREVGPVALEAYLPASADVSAVKRRIEAEDGLQCSLQLESLKMNVLRQTAFFKWSLLLAGVILAVISIAMLGSFSKLSVLERKKEIAIIKSLGASDMEVLMILWFDSVCISVISAVMAAGVTFAFAEVVPFMIPEFAFAEFGFPMKTLIMLSGVFFAMVLVFTFFGMRRLIRTMPAELMRGG
ncbi:ABC transporter permease [Candidatus Nomurabacteria bacterium]|nr:ABC transporter permease [Candidatus Nomurabacteria bacterium]